MSLSAAALGVVASLALLAPAANAAQATSNFQDTTVWSSLFGAVAVRFAPAPDTRVFVEEASGKVVEFDSLSDTTATTVVDLGPEVHTFSDRGMLGLAIDPNFPINPYIYVMYAYDAPIGGAPPTWGDDCADPPGANTDGCVVSGRLSRIQINPVTNIAVPSSEQVLINDWCQQYSSHSVGDLAFGADGSLYASAGEGASFTFPDYGQGGGTLRHTPTPKNPCGDPPAGVGGNETPPTAEGGRLRSQDVRTPSDPTGLSGSLIRVDPASGAGLPGNPLFGSSNANERRMVAYGMRNPFRFTLRPGTNEVWLGDVGLSNWEEIDRVQNPTDTSLDNFGWPCYEGNGHNAEYDALGLNLCTTLYSQSGAGAAIPPYFTYPHGQNIVPNEACTNGGSSAISGIAFYPGGSFPATYEGALFFSDFARGCIWAMQRGANGLPDPTKLVVFDTGNVQAVDIQISPSGDLFYADLAGTIHRVRYTGPTGSAPTAVASANPTNGPAPLNVTFDATGSTDPDPGDTLTYAWDLDGDGQYDDSTAAQPSQTYTQVGNHTVGLKVTDTDGLTDTDSLTISVGNSPPTAHIDTPSPSFTWSVGDPIDISGSATDPQETLPDSAYFWDITQVHCPGDCHTHPWRIFDGVTSGTFPAPDHDYPSHLRISLTVTDAGGLQDTDAIDVFPKTVDVTLGSNPSGLQAVLDNITGPTPLTKTVIAKGTNTVSTPTTQTLNGNTYLFHSWSDGGASTHNFNAGTVDQNLVADFNRPPVASFNTSPTQPAPGESVSFDGSGSSDPDGQIAKYEWDLDGNGGFETDTGTNPNASHSYTQPGPLAVGLKVTDNDGDTNITTRTVTVTGLPSPTLTDTDPDSPANDNSPEVKGTAAAGTTVKLYANATCTGSPTATGTAAAFASPGLTVSAGDNTSTTFHATDTDASSNVSLCSSSSITYVEDSAPPAPPTLTGTNPASPANDNSPRVLGSAEAGSTVRLYTTIDCSGAAAATGGAASLASPGLQASVPGDASTTFHATATDALGNTSACSTGPTGSVTYIEDSTPPALPTLSGTNPASPANNNSPRVLGSADPGSTVKLYATSDCSGAIAAQGSDSAFNSPGLQVSVGNDTTTTLHATATDAVGNASACSSSTVTYTEDSTPPAQPTLTGTSPASPANDSSPEITGTAAAGSTVKLYTDSTCTGAVAATGSAANFSSPGLTATVTDNTTTTFHATATDAVGNTSTCSSSTVTYTSDSTPPAQPTLTGTVPASPANDNSPRVLGSAEAGSTVKLYIGLDCSGAAAATGNAAGLASPGLQASVPGDASSTFHATATDQAGNTSACSSSTVTYVEDSTGPAGPTFTGTTPSSPSNVNSPSIRGSAESGSTVKLYTDSNCTGAVAATGGAAGFGSSGLAVTVPADSTTTFHAIAQDQAGNPSACSADTATYVEDSAVPAQPNLSGTAPPSPASDNSPRVLGSAESGSTVKLYPSSDCSGAAAATGSAAALNSPGLQVSVGSDTTTTFHATATDQAGNTSACSSSTVTYVEDSTGPAGPTFTGTTPSSPSNVNSPSIRGSAEAGSTVRLYTDSNCTGPVAAQGSAATFSSTGLQVTVPDDSTTTFHATATDASSNTSTCSSSTVTYVEDSTDPAPPTLTGTTPASPANDTNPEVSGNAESGSTVKLYTDSNCTGPVAATGSQASFNSPGLTAAVGDDSSTTFHATATDQAGNTSACSSSTATYVEDSTDPAQPNLSGTAPASPANDNSPRVLGSAESGSTVKLYTDSNCTGAVAATGSEASLNSPGLQLSVGDDSSTTFHATATDAAGNTSGCSSSTVTYTEDSSLPAAPNSLSTSPTSPSANNNPFIRGNAEAGSTVRLYTTSDCSGAVAAQGSAATFNSTGLQVTVADDTTTTFHATATDSSNNTSACSTSSVDYVEDSTPPARPTITGTTPASPSNDNNPRILGGAAAGSTVKLYTDSNCTGAVAASGSAAGFGSPGLAVTVPADSTTTFHATATDQAGNRSQCSADTATYVEDSIAPVAPNLTGTVPPTPGNDNSPLITGTAAAGSTVKLYDNSACTGTPAAQGSAASFASPGLQVAVADDSSTSFYATATDQAGNASGCSTSPITYVEDSAAPVAPQLTGTSPASPANDNEPHVKGTAEAGSTVKLYAGSDCSGSPADTGSAADFASPGLHASVPDDSVTTFHATATDASGNTSSCSSSSISYTEHSTTTGPVTTDHSVELALSAPQSQHPLDQKGVIVFVECPAERCTAQAEGMVTIPSAGKASAAVKLRLKRVSRTLARGERAKLKLKLSKRLRGRIKHALANHRTRRRVRAKITITVADSAGNHNTRHVTVKLRR